MQLVLCEEDKTKVQPWGEGMSAQNLYFNKRDEGEKIYEYNIKKCM